MSIPPKNPLSPKKLLLTKWTAVAPQHKEKHFVVIRVVERELTDASQWRQGWV